MVRMTIASVAEASEVLRRGGVALVPTDTVVGLVASEAGLARLARMKNRDPAKPIALLCSSSQDAFAQADKVRSLARTLARDYWPGPLTLVLDAVDGGTVGVRVPGLSVVRDLLTAYGEPLHATSANIAGEPAPRTLEDVDERILEAVDVVVAGEPGSGEASAVVDLSAGEARLLRSAGELTEDRLRRLAEHTPFSGEV